jgi:hypothetical protein
MCFKKYLLFSTFFYRGVETRSVLKNWNFIPYILNDRRFSITEVCNTVFPYNNVSGITDWSRCIIKIYPSIYCVISNIFIYGAKIPGTRLIKKPGSRVAKRVRGKISNQNVCDVRRVQAVAGWRQDDVYTQWTTVYDTGECENQARGTVNCS